MDMDMDMDMGMDMDMSCVPWGVRALCELRVSYV